MLEKMKELITQYVDVTPEEITEDARLIEDLHFNSYDFMSMLGELEETFDVTVDEQEMTDIRTVGEVIKYIESLQG
ncbi:MAG: acyl carrier protein [Oscillospiraceae bacterium]|nr:acyl carrier protein [Oscillospiraceae bacterium]MBQ8012300.1 acyl carrier protein [Oscillospiraceae bacterium]